MITWGLQEQLLLSGSPFCPQKPGDEVTHWELSMPGKQSPCSPVSGFPAVPSKPQLLIEAACFSGPENEPAFLGAKLEFAPLLEVSVVWAHLLVFFFFPGETLKVTQIL